MKYKFLLFIIIFTCSELFPQIVITVPQFPTQNDSITIYFDATQPGAEELFNYTGTVYTHTGVNTNLGNWQHVIGDWGNNNNQPALTRDSANHYHLTIGHPREFYSVTNPAEQIEALCFVFRSSDAAQQTRPDIFVDLYQPGLNLVVNSPEVNMDYGDPLRSPVFSGENDTIDISVSSIALGTVTSSVSLFINGISVAQSDSGTVDYQFLASDYSSGAQIVTAIAADTSDLVDTLTFAIMINPPVTDLPLPAGNVHGINYTSPTSVTLALYAPYKDYVYVIGDFNNWEVDSSYYMYRDEESPDSVIWWFTINNLAPGQEYAFQYLVDGRIRIGDPYTEKVLDPANDQYISDTTYPDLKPYPAGKTSEIVSVLQTDQQPYQWQVTNFQRPAKKDLVIYELLVRDFVSTHDYKTLTDTLGYLKDLGINAVELMPVMEFEGNESWGYNPNFNFAPDKYYGPKNDLKTFIDSCHQSGIAVIFDAPMNDIFNSSPLARLYWDNANNRPAADNPWLNPIPRHPYNVGNDYNYESPAMKYYIDRFTKFWLTQYHIDGYRFDLSKGYTQTYSGNNVDLWNQYDQSRINNLERIADNMWAIDPSAYVILEHFAVNSEEQVLSNYGMMLWGNMNCNYNQATMGYPSGPCSWDFSGVSYIVRNWNNPYLLGYMESHDEERLMFKNLQYGNSHGDYNIKHFSTAIQRIKEAAAFFFTVPGPKMIWQFGELGYDVSIDDPCRTCNKPILWNYYDDPARLKLYKVFKALINLKKNDPAFESGNFSISASGAQKRINIYASSMDVTIIGNFDVQSGTIDPNFSRTGRWYDYFSGDSIDVSGTHDNISLLPGEFHIYTTVKLPTPEGDILNDIQNNNDQVVTEYSLEQNFPNPFNPSTIIKFSIPKEVRVNLSVYDVLGAKVQELKNEVMEPGYYEVNFNASALASGVYFYRIKAGDFIQTKKMVLVK